MTEKRTNSQAKRVFAYCKPQFELGAWTVRFHLLFGGKVSVRMSHDEIDRIILQIETALADGYNFLITPDGARYEVPENLLQTLRRNLSEIANETNEQLSASEAIAAAEAAKSCAACYSAQGGPEGAFPKGQAPYAIGEANNAIPISSRCAEAQAFSREMKRQSPNGVCGGCQPNFLQSCNVTKPDVGRKPMPPSGTTHTSRTRISAVCKAKTL